MSAVNLHLGISALRKKVAKRQPVHGTKNRTRKMSGINVKVKVDGTLPRIHSHIWESMNQPLHVLLYEFGMNNVS